MQRDQHYSSSRLVLFRNSSFWQNKVYADIRRGSLGKETSNDSGVSRHAHVLRLHAEVYSLYDLPDVTDAQFLSGS